MEVVVGEVISDKVDPALGYGDDRLFGEAAISVADVLQMRIFADKIRQPRSESWPLVASP
jgi:hypothetical protein